jgi:hypothetical protein
MIWCVHSGRSLGECTLLILLLELLELLGGRRLHAASEV